ncbi:MAG: tripartite tricarboxylate transporter TctB family protein [Candidatus Limnocylindria bacterium]
MTASRRLARTVAGRGALVTALAALAIFAYGAYEINTAFTLRARLFGNTLIVPAVLLGALLVLQELRRTAPFPVPPEAAFTRSALVWLGAFFVSMSMIGLAVTVPLFALAYLRLAAGESWAKAAAYAVASWLFLELLFIRLLHVPLPGGAIPLPAITF